MSASPTVPRSLTQMLREREDRVLIQRLLDRPDLAFPPPTVLSDVASRATTRHSVTDALAGLDTFELWVATLTVSMAAPFAVEELPAEGADPTAVRIAIRRLVELGLLWGDPQDLTALRPVRALASLLEDTPAGPAPASEPPELAFEERSTTLVEKVAAGSAFELVRRMGVLLEHCDHRPLPLRRDGQLSTREVRAFATLLDVPAATATTLFELATLAGLVGPGSVGNHEVLIPTRAFDDWQTLSLAGQWAVLVQTWRDRHSESGAPRLKQLVLDAFGDPEEGHVVSPDDVRRWVAWHRPRRPLRSDKIVSTMLEQASWLGITGMGALATFAIDVNLVRLGALLPPCVEHVLIQADLTAVAPGPLTPDAAHDLGLLADVESRGGATVYRISPESLSRAHVLGWSSSEILGTLERRSSTPLPQALEYLIRDLERGTAQPVNGEAVRADRHREPQRGTPVSFDDLTAVDRLDPEQATDLVAALRQAGEVRRVGLPGNGAAGQQGAGEALFDSPLATLREAVETGEIVWVGYVDPIGARTERLVRARRLDDGVLRARDTRSDADFAVAVHRITAAHIIRTDGGSAATTS